MATQSDFTGPDYWSSSYWGGGSSSAPATPSGGGLFAPDYLGAGYWGADYFGVAAGGPAPIIPVPFSAGEFTISLGPEITIQPGV